MVQEGITAAAIAVGMQHTHTTGVRGRGARQQPWFDTTCRQLRDACRQAELTDGRDSSAAKIAHRTYFKHIQRTKRAWQDKELEQMVDSYKHDPARFWRDWKAQHGKHVPLGIDRWTAHFRSILGAVPSKPLMGGTVEAHCTTHSDMFPTANEQDTQQATGLNESITIAEVFEALKHLKNGKAAGVDGIAAEFLKHSSDPGILRSMTALARPLTHVFNTVFTGSYPAQWATCTLTPVPKRGDLQDPNNFRGIAVSTAIAKLFSLVLYLRMDKWAEKTNRRAAGQAGFRTGRSTTDGIFVLQHCIEACRAAKKELYVAFIDFEKAYDSINRDLLWRALSGMGVHGIMLNCLKSMHTAIQFTVKESGVCGEPFRVESGVKQGDPLSPLLFGLFIDRLETFLNERYPSIGVSVVAAFIRSLLYADDLALMALSASALQSLLDGLSLFSAANHLTVNISKCKCVVFNKSSRRDVCFTYEGKSIDVADWFDYLGTRFYKSYKNTKAHVKKNLAIRVGKAETAMTLLRRRCGELDIQCVALRSNLFNALVSSVLASGCEVWGLYHVRKWLSDGHAWGVNCEPEKLHRRFLRWAFGVMPQSVSSLVLLLEAGRCPLIYGWLKQTLTWYNRVALTRTRDDLVHLCLSESLSSVDAGSWGRVFLSIVGTIDPVCTAGVAELQAIDISKFLPALQGKWQSSWPAVGDTLLRDISDESSHFKFVTYCRWFQPLKEDKDHLSIYHLLRAKEIRTVAAFRMGGHKLNIEAMRHGREPPSRDRRVCTLCRDNTREDELHVFECPAYKELRERFGFDWTEEQRLAFNSPDSYMRSIVNPGNVTAAWRKFASFLIAVFAHREALIILQRNPLPM
jgi:sorting nexin-29